MHRLLKTATLLLALIGLAEPAYSESPSVLVNTSVGDIIVDLDEVNAPATVKNFLRYVDDGHYKDTLVHRVIKGFMIQGGGYSVSFKAKPTYEPIANEADNGLKNARGTIAMARTSDPHSATAQFFINHADNEMLDHKANTPLGWGYAVFGRVTSGMDVVDKIADAPTGVNPEGLTDVPKTPIIIKGITRIGTPYEYGERSNAHGSSANLGVPQPTDSADSIGISEDLAMEAGKRAFFVSALTSGAAAIIAVVLFMVVRAKGAASSAHHMGRRWLAWMLVCTTFVTLPRFFADFDINFLAQWIVANVVFGGLAYGLGWAYWKLVRGSRWKSGGSGMNGSQDNQLYEVAWEEIESGSMVKGLWARSYAKFAGNPEKVRAFYVKERVKELDQAARKIKGPE